MSVKKKIEVNIIQVEFGGSLKEHIAKLQQYLQTASVDHTNIRIDEETINYPYDDTEYHHVYVKGTRLETDAEYEKRDAIEKAQQAIWEARERAQFEALSKKYGNKQ